MIDALDMVSTVGFPIVMVFLLFWQSNKTIKENTRAIRELILHIKK